MQTPKSRHPGMDVLRPFAMLMLVGMHFLMLSGIFEATDRAMANYAFAVIGKAYTSTALNCFWLISGYFLCGTTSVRWGRFAGLWGWTLFYSLVSYGLLAALGKCDAVAWHALFPVTFNVYWFVDVYLALLLLLPAVNAGVQAMSRTVFRNLLVALLGLTSLLPMLGMRTFELGSFTLGWAVTMYLTGAYLRRYDPFAGFSRARLALLPLGSGFLLLAAIGVNFVAKSRGFGQVFDYSSYGFPATAAFSLAVFACFDKLPIGGASPLVRCCSRLSPFVFGVYIIHVSPLFRQLVWPLVTGSDFHSPLFIVRFLLGVPLVFAACLAIDAACHRGLAALCRCVRKEERP